MPKNLHGASMSSSFVLECGAPPSILPIIHVRSAASSSVPYDPCRPLSSPSPRGLYTSSNDRPRRSPPSAGETWSTLRPGPPSDSTTAGDRELSRVRRGEGDSGPGGAVRVGGMKNEVRHIPKYVVELTSSSFLSSCRILHARSNAILQLPFLPFKIRGETSLQVPALADERATPDRTCVFDDQSDVAGKNRQHATETDQDEDGETASLLQIAFLVTRWSALRSA
mmetsp:Transcript_58189/g.123419  ORF Transcript_58189/g.123419 Transcript_58189/m.123419 type:complete len:225 (-) Transcript_58189:424-1098(-)